MFLLLFVSCGSSTSITGSWKNENALQSKTYKKVFIMAITTNVPAKTIIEDEYAFYAKRNGMEVVKGHDEFPGTFTKQTVPSRDQLIKIIRDTGSDVIMTITLQDKETQSRYVPGTTNYAMGYNPMGFGYYGSFYGYYNYWYPMTYDPGYYTTDKIYFLETNLYDVQSEELLWSAQSKTYNPSDLEDFTKDYTQAIIKKMQSDGLLVHMQ
ncbi:hypothetical protein DMZ48_15030 [Robertkochia solimangrovi]|nr:hypothetical protein DMZ48_15030 [Robertkochia solimangrovi]